MCIDLLLEFSNQILLTVDVSVPVSMKGVTNCDNQSDMYQREDMVPEYEMFEILDL